MVRCNDEVEAQSRFELDRWTFCKTIYVDCTLYLFAG
jgi:hypothetical protein